MMRLFIAFILNILFFTSVNGQTKSSLIKKEDEPKFANQGEQEDYWAKKLFKEKYQPQKLEAFKGSILRIKDNTFKFNHAVLVTIDVKPTLKAIFANGLLYPSLLSGNPKDTITIISLEEVEFLNKLPHVRRFRFVLSGDLISKKMINSNVWFAELTNDKAVATTSLISFIKGSKLTFITYAWTQV